jgi:hypothetical protein
MDSQIISEHLGIIDVYSPYTWVALARRLCREAFRSLDMMRKSIWAMFAILVDNIQS